MKKLILLILTISLLFYCGPKQEKVERYMEDGVEVVVNHLEPYKIKGEPATLNLVEEFTIDTERDEITEVGLVHIHGFDVDSKGDIYIQRYKGEGNYIFKFDRGGNFVTSFAPEGQGPGELIGPQALMVTSKDEIAITDPMRRMFFLFGKDGDVIRKIKLFSRIEAVLPLKNGRYLVEEPAKDLSAKDLETPLSLYNSEFKKEKELDMRRFQDKGLKKILGIYYYLSWRLSRGRIFTGFPERGYEIYVYDLEGHLLRKIRKKYKPVAVHEEYKKKYMKRFDHPMFAKHRKKIYFPDYLPPYHAFFTDDEGRLFVMTYERGKNPGEYIYDIFNEDGIFVGRRSLKIHYHVRVCATVKKGRLYCLNEKESGYMELLVYKMNWE